MNQYQEGPEIKVFDFSDPEQLKYWTSGPGTELELTESVPLVGGREKGDWLKLTFAGMDASLLNQMVEVPESERNDFENPAQSPSVHIRTVSASIPWLDGKNLALSTFDYLLFEAHNPSDAPLYFNVGLKDISGNTRNVFEYVELEPREQKTVKIPLRRLPFSPRIDRINRYLTTDDPKVKEIEWVIPYNPQEAVLYVADIRLEVSPFSHMESEAYTVEAKGESEKVLDVLRSEFERWRKGATVSPVEMADWRRRADSIVQSTEIEERSLMQDHVAGEGTFSLAVESPMRQVFLEKSRFQGQFPGQKGHQLYAARNESESFQAIVFPTNRNGLKNVSFEISPFVNERGDSIPATVDLVGFVETTLQPRYHVPFLGWYPDPILDHIRKVSSVPFEEVLPLWVKVDVPNDAVAGQYRGTLTVKAGEDVRDLDIGLEVWDFTLPKTSSSKVLVQFYRLNSMSQFHVTKEPEGSLLERGGYQTELFEDWMLRYRMQPGNIYSWSPPGWDAVRLKKLVDDGLNAINLSYIRIDRKEADNYSAKEFWERFDQQVERIENYIPVLKEAGVWDNDEVLKYIFLFDEWPGRHIDIVYEVARKLKQHFPEIKLITSAYDHSYGLFHPEGNHIDVWLPHVNTLQANRRFMDFARNQGKEFGWYFAIGAYAPLPNFWLENPVIQSRITGGVISYHYDTPVFLYWAVNRWYNNNPRFLDRGPKTRWRAMSYGTTANNGAHGEGSLFYARNGKGGDGTVPVSSLRLENLRDGLEDFEYFKLLNELRKEKGMEDYRLPKHVFQHVASYANDPSLLEGERINIAKEILKLRN